MVEQVSIQGWVEEIAATEFVLRSKGRPIIVVGLSRDLNLTRESVVTVRGRHIDAERIAAGEINVINRCTRLPFPPRERNAVSAALRARYRYLELRDCSVRDRFEKLHHFRTAVAQRLDQKGFISVDTPVLARRSGSGATEFTASGHKKRQWALPQSPQVYGQLLVIGGIERYYQWAHCFRDENLRANRQPEFTQLHVEIAFSNANGMIELIEDALTAGARAIGVELPAQIPKIPYRTAMRRYRSDKPDLRYDPTVELIPLLRLCSAGERSLFVVTPPPGLSFDSKAVAEIRRKAANYGFGLLGFVRPDCYRNKRFALQLTEEQIMKKLFVGHKTAAKTSLLFSGNRKKMDDLINIVFSWACHSNQTPASSHMLAWIDRFPMFDKQAEGGLAAFSHPFAMPEDPEAFMQSRSHRELLSLDGQVMDLVLDGEEIGSGSTLIYDYDMQMKMLRDIGVTKQSVRSSYGFVLDALRAGAPPMTGFGLGVERVVAQLLQVPKIKDLMAFPKTKEGNCPVTS